jgi:hypothetical protein
MTDSIDLSLGAATMPGMDDHESPDDTRELLQKIQKLQEKSQRLVDACDDFLARCRAHLQDAHLRIKRRDPEQSPAED